MEEMNGDLGATPCGHVFHMTWFHLLFHPPSLLFAYSPTSIEKSLKSKPKCPNCRLAAAVKQIRRIVYTIKGRDIEKI